MRPIVDLIDRYLDHVTMYRLVLYYLVGLVAAAIALGALGLVPHAPIDIAYSTCLLLAVCWVANRAFVLVFAVPANAESAYITGLILALIMDPVSTADWSGAVGLAFAALWAVSSKFILAVQRKHLFNPAALGVALTATFLDQPATWWIGGNLQLLPVVLLGGVIMVRKLRRFDLVGLFILANIATALAGTSPSHFGTVIRETFLSSPLFFFAFVMLTEPLTAPTTRWPRLAFATLVGILASPNVHFGSFYLTPEIALLIGNLFTYLVSPKGRLAIVLQRIEQSAADSYDFIFAAPRRLAFQPGQYLEWTLDVGHGDSRGNRRYFTLASSPTEKEVRLGVKFYPKPSAFKQALGNMERGDLIYGAQLAGDFTLPRNPETKLAFLAGGIGITPFRSMLQYLIDHNERRPVVVLYANERARDIAYRDVLDQAERKLAIRTHYAVASGAAGDHYAGYIDRAFIEKAIPDFTERMFYVSGPQAMVQAVKRTLLGMGVHRSRIKVDFFPGFA